MENIEVEIRSFISKEEYDNLLKFFTKSSTPTKQDSQETYYFNAKEDLRIQKNNDFAKIWLKKGKIHDDCRKELEVKFKKEDFEKIEEILTSVGFDIEIKWLRKRYEFDWDKIKVCLDYTKGYGYIIELEKISSEEEKETALEELKQKLEKLDIKLTPKNIFNEKFENYKNNWRTLIENDTTFN
jgi:predicted adenylyl cyclase CyaB